MSFAVGRTRVAHRRAEAVGAAGAGRVPFLGAISAAAVLAVAGATVGWSAWTVTPGAGGSYQMSGDAGQILGKILAQNLGSMLLLFSGYATFGVGTVVGLMFTSAFIGATWHAMSLSLGTGELILRVAPYAILEFGGLILAAVAGLLPVVALVHRSLGSDVRTGAPAAPRPSSTGTALRLLAAATVVIVLAALVETALIVAHPGGPS